MSLRTAVSTFSLLPVGEQVAPADAATLLWLPLVGAGLGALAGLPLAAALGMNAGAGLVAALLGLAALALLTRGLHLDGLADTADGLGSRAPAERALEIMRQSDIGPFGVLSVVFVVGLDAAALVTFTGSQWHGLAALTVAAATGRVTVLHAALKGVPSARPGGFGALVAGSVEPAVAVLQTAGVLALGAGLAEACDIAAWRWLVAQGVALVLAWAFRVHTTRRLGGVTGDVFGALVELGTAATLVGLALAT
ncbi:adenosylcobinamide-GDP ribazoletransferase [Jatrophihabitans sp.]|uniref:adenosylcobinamide-GDP ribazoletransferase n=1 Tax=Jatrophihabitans sp. TaxID=1932789 RepID=UPI0030C70BC7|nr:cobalamin-5-phosphate synthase CobS [Jatrophihabitans sp.]